MTEGGWIRHSNRVVGTVKLKGGSPIKDIGLAMMKVSLYIEKVLN